MTEPISVDELRFAIDHPELYGSFQSTLPSAGRHCFTGNGIDYMVRKEEVGGPEKVYKILIGEVTELDSSKADSTEQNHSDVL